MNALLKSMSMKCVRDVIGEPESWRNRLNGHSKEPPDMRGAVLQMRSPQAIRLQSRRRAQPAVRLFRRLLSRTRNCVTALRRSRANLNVYEAVAAEDSSIVRPRSYGSAPVYGSAQTDRSSYGPIKLLEDHRRIQHVYPRRHTRHNSRNRNYRLPLASRLRRLQSSLTRASSRWTTTPVSLLMQTEP